MKTKNIKYLVCLVGAVLAMGPVFTSCKLDEPEATPAEELYLRAFITKYGLIDPTQDWNQAQRSSVTVIVNKAKKLDVFVEIEKNYYRVAKYLDVAGTVEIPIDVPECVTTLYILADDDYRSVELGGTADFTSKRRAVKKAPAQAQWINDWSNVTRTRQDGSSDAYVGNAGQARSVINLPTTNYIDLTTTAHLGAETTTLYTDIYSGTAHSNIYEAGRIHQGMNMHFMLHNPTISGYEITFNTAVTSESSIYNSGGERGNIINVTIVDKDNTVWMDQNITYDVCGTSKLMNDAHNSEDPNSNKHKVTVPILPPGDFQMIVTMTRGKTSSGNNVTGGQLGLFQIQDLPVENLAWLLVAEDLGATDDFDFNDVIIRVQSLTTNVANLVVQNEYWQVIQDENSHLVFSAPARGESQGGTRGGDAPHSQSRADTYTNLTIEAMCAGGTLDSYLHFVTKADKDVVLCPTTEVVDITSSSFTASHLGDKATEWHSWFTKNNNTPIGVPNKRLMINTGLNDGWVGGKCNITVEGDFSVSNYSDIRFRDYDQHTGDGNDYWDQNRLMTSWTYGSNVEDYAIYGFYITVGDAVPAATTRMIGAPKKGAAPQMFCIPDCNARGLWHWPRERVPIVQVYTGFRDWVSNNSNKDWYLPYPITVGVTTHEGVPDLTAVYPRQGD